MLTNNIMTIAERVSSAMQGYNAEIAFSPEFSLSETAKQKCLVVPISTEYKNVSRTQIEVLYRIDIGFFFRTKNLDMTSMIETASHIATDFLNKRLENVMCIKATHSPLFDSDLLRERNQFVSVVTLTFKEFQYA